MNDELKEFMTELKSSLKDQLLPHKNPNIAWFWVFFSGMLLYISLLMQILNGKPHVGSIEVLDPAKATKLFKADWPLEVIATDGQWTEGPLWIDNDDGSPFLLYSDTKQNKVYRWEEGRGFFTIGKTLYLPKSGCRENSTYCDEMYEPGSNGLARVFPKAADGSGALDMIMCQHGERAIALQRENGTRTFIATHYKGARLNSPNDLIFSPEGHLYFTDPNYGLWKRGEQPKQLAGQGRGKWKKAIEEAVWIGEYGRELQEQPHSGLYMIHRSEIAKAIATGKPAENIFLIDAKMSFPNGLAFSPGFSRLYVSNSDPKNAYWKVFDVNSNGLAVKGRTFFNATHMLSDNGDSMENDSCRNSKDDKCSDKGSQKTYSFGNPDGLKVDISGNIYASGPGGVMVFSPEGDLIGRLNTDRPVSNVAFGNNGYLYITSEDLLLRKRFFTKPPREMEYKGKQKSV